MSAKPTQLAKLARPVADGLIERNRLFALLDQTCRQRIVWISGPAGAGKTSLMTSYLENRHLPCLWFQIDAGDGDLPTFFLYLRRAVQSLFPRKRLPPKLTPEYLSGLETFSRQFFRALFKCLGPPHVLVFDNFHDAPADPSLFMAIVKLTEEIPPGITVVFISRYDPPPPLARMYSRAEVINWEELKITLEEAEKLLSLHGIKDSSVVRNLNEAAQGWMAGLVLLARSPDNIETIKPNEAKQPQLLYDYFSQEVLSKIPDSSHDILIKTALFPSVTPASAKALTGLDYAGEAIADLQRNRFFIDLYSPKSEIYVYHPLFRAYLLGQLESRYQEADRMILKRKAAQLLEIQNQIETAVNLYLEACSWDDVSRLIENSAYEFLSEGRHLLLTRWIDSLPVSERNQNPSLLYWFGMSRMPFSPQESRARLEPAFQLYELQENIEGMYLTVSALLMSYYYEMGNFAPVAGWLSQLETLNSRYPGFPSIEAEVQAASAMMAVLMHCPQHALIKSLKHRVVTLIRVSPTPQQKISVASPALLHSLLAGDFNAAEQLLNELKDLLDMKRISPLDAIAFKIFESIYAWKQGQYSIAINKLEEANAVARNYDVHLFDGWIFTHKCLAYAGAEHLLEAAQVVKEAKVAVRPANKADLFNVKYHEIALDLKQGLATRSCLDQLKEIIQLTQVFAIPYYEAESRLLYSQALAIFGEYASTQREFDWLKNFSDIMPSQHIKFRTLIVEANTAFLSGAKDHGICSLKQALAIGSSNGYLSCFPLWQPNLLSEILAKALEADIEINYVCRLIRLCKLKAPVSGIERWPWPIRICTFGNFKLVIDDRALHFQGKAQRKPLDLLKCLIASGGQGVGLNLLISQLWPELDGDAARNACDLALHRLRKLLNWSNALEMQDGKLNLDTSLIWVDAWAFERLCGSLASDQFHSDPSVLADKLLNLYPGHFLESEESAWALSYRERLNSKFQRAIKHLILELSMAKDYEKAIVLCRKAIELDPLAEEFHYNLMRCYQAQGRIAEAISAYRHCREMLTIVLGVKPSDQTQALYLSLKSS